MSGPTSPSPLSPAGRAPEWIREKKLGLGQLHAVKKLARFHALSTVCEEAQCPNRGECFSRGTATFLMLGTVCTRPCGFCDIANGRPAPPDPFEPARVASAAREMALGYVVLTSVARDDLPDGGAGHFVAAIRALRGLAPPPGVEVLVPDFRGRFESLRAEAEETMSELRAAELAAMAAQGDVQAAEATHRMAEHADAELRRTRA